MKSSIKFFLIWDYPKLKKMSEFYEKRKYNNIFSMSRNSISNLEDSHKSLWLNCSQRHVKDEIDLIKKIWNGWFPKKLIDGIRSRPKRLGSSFLCGSVKTRHSLLVHLFSTFYIPGSYKRGEKKHLTLHIPIHCPHSQWEW